MTPKDRFAAAARGEVLDRKPVLRWPCPKGSDSDAVVVQTPEPNNSEGKALFVEVYNPFGTALWRGIDLNQELKANPASPLLSELVEETRSKLREALGQGADGILYILYGARAKHCSPMQYGGHYLEYDRELLAEIQGKAVSVMFVVGDDAYFDFVSDLPADVFAWDAPASGIDAGSMRLLRQGPLCSADQASEVILACEAPNLAKLLEKDDLAAY